MRFAIRNQWGEVVAQVQNDPDTLIDEPRRTVLRKPLLMSPCWELDYNDARQRLIKEPGSRCVPSCSPRTDLTRFCNASVLEDFWKGLTRNLSYIGK